MRKHFGKWLMLILSGVFLFFVMGCAAESSGGSSDGGSSSKSITVTFVDEDGKVCIDYQYDNARSFTIEFAPVKQEDAWGYIDLNNKQVIPCTFSEATPFYQDGTASVKNEEQWSMIKLNIYQ